MYAYNSRYKHYGEDVNKVILLYPQSNSYDEKVVMSKSLSGASEEIKLKIEIVYVNLVNDNWIQKI